MKNLLKVIITISITILTIQVNASIELNQKDLILSKSNLEKIKGGENYIKQIDAVIEKYKNNERVLKMLSLKISSVKAQIASSKNKTKQTEKLLIILQYFDLKNQIALNEAISKKNLKIFENNLSNNENKIVNDAIIDLQLNLFESFNDKISSIKSSYDSMSQYTERGDSKMDLLVDLGESTKVNFSALIQDYFIAQSGFDSQISSNVDLKLSSIFSGEEESSLDMKTYLDYISKDGTNYLLLKNFQLNENKNLFEYEELLENLKELSKKNKYIKIDAPETSYAINYLKNLSPDIVLKNLKKRLSKPFFRAYKKSGNKYLLVPSREACDSIKNMLYFYDDYINKSCTDKEYDDILLSIADSGEIYLEISSNSNKLGFTNIKTSDIETLEGHIIYNNKYIDEISADIIPDQDLYLNERFKISYKKGENLNLSLVTANSSIALNSNLDSENDFENMDFSIYIDGNYMSAIGNLKIKDNKIDGELVLTSKSYDYISGDYIDGSILTLSVTGETNNKNNIENINIAFNGVEDSAEYLDGNFSYKNGEINEYILNIDYKDNFTSFLSNLSFVNGEISGETVYNSFGSEVISFNHTGEYGNEYIDMKNRYELGEMAINFIKTLYNNSDNENPIEIESLNGNIDFIYDFRETSFIKNIFANLIMNNEKSIFSLVIENTAERENKNTTISAPDNYIDSSEVFNSGIYY